MFANVASSAESDLTVTPQTFGVMTLTWAVCLASVLSKSTLGFPGNQGNQHYVRDSPHSHFSKTRARYNFLIWTKTGICRQISVKLTDIKCIENPPRWSRIITWLQTYMAKVIYAFFSPSISSKHA